MLRLANLTGYCGNEFGILWEYEKKPFSFINWKPYLIDRQFAPRLFDRQAKLMLRYPFEWLILRVLFLYCFEKLSVAHPSHVLE